MRIPRFESWSPSQPSSYDPRRQWRGRGRKRETTVPREESRQLYAWLPVIILVLVLVTLAVGGVALHYAEHYLIAATGDSLALAAADIADKLDTILFERYADTQVLAHSPAFRTRDVAAMTRRLNCYKDVYGYYLWLGVTDATGRIVAATGPASGGPDR